MTVIRHSILMVASIFAFGLWVGYAAADEPDEGTPAADILDIDNGALGASELVTISSGTSMVAVSAADSDIENNDITTGENSHFQTGDASATMANAGGINVNMVNSGNNVAMQANTTINLYLDSAAGGE
jgi:hypothetical protein